MIDSPPLSWQYQFRMAALADSSPILLDVPPTDSVDESLREAVGEIREFAQAYRDCRGLLRPKQAEVLLGVSGARVREMIGCGILETREYGGFRYITGRSVIARIAENPPKQGGRPKQHLTWADRLRFFQNALSFED